MLINKKRVRELAKEYNISLDYYGELEKQTEKLIKKSMKRATENNRKTIMLRDL